MAFVRPTLGELVDRVQHDFVSRLGTSGAVLRRSVVHVLARVVAGAAHMLHGHIEYVSRQLFPDQSDELFLARQAEIFGIRRTPATFARATIAVTGTNGSVVPAGTVLLRADGAEYSTTEEVTILAGSVAAEVIASDPGAAGTLVPGVVLTFESTIAGVAATATVTASVEDGSDQESIESLRERLLDRMRRPPHGGAAADYVAWAREVPGVTRAWVYPQENGAGTVTVRFVRDEDPNPIPDAGEVAAVQAHIDELRPVTAAVTVLAPVAAPIDFELEITPDTTATRDAVEAELRDLLFRLAEPGATIPISQIRLAVGLAEGITDFVVHEPTADVTHAAGEMATLGTITWV